MDRPRRNHDYSSTTVLPKAATVLLAVAVSCALFDVAASQPSEAEKEQQREIGHALFPRKLENLTTQSATPDMKTGYYATFELDKDLYTMYLLPPEHCLWVSLCDHNHKNEPYEKPCIDIYPAMRLVTKNRNAGERIFPDRMIFGLLKSGNVYDLLYDTENEKYSFIDDAPFLSATRGEGKKMKNALEMQNNKLMLTVFSNSPHCDVQFVSDLQTPENPKGVAFKSSFYDMSLDDGTQMMAAGIPMNVTGSNVDYRTVSPLQWHWDGKNNVQLDAHTSKLPENQCPSLFEYGFYTEHWKLDEKEATVLSYQFMKKQGDACKNEVVTEEIVGESTKEYHQFTHGHYSFLLEIEPKKCTWARLCFRGCEKPTDSIDLLFQNHIYIPTDSDQSRSFNVDPVNLNMFRFTFKPMHARTNVSDNEGDMIQLMNRIAMLEFAYPLHKAPIVRDHMMVNFNPYANNAESSPFSSSNDAATVTLHRSEHCRARLLPDPQDGSSVKQQCLNVVSCTRNVRK